MSFIMVLQIALLILLVLLLFLIFARVGKLLCARKLGLGCGWMAFMPFLNAYLDGRMAEASDDILDPERKKKRKWGRRNLLLRVLSVISIGFFAAALVVFLITLVLAFFGDIMHIKMGSLIDMIKMGVNYITNIVSYIRDNSFLDTIKEYKFTCIISLSVMAVSLIILIISAVVGYLIMYKTYSAFSTKKAGLFLVLSFLLLPSAAVIFMVLGCAKKYAPLETAEACAEVGEVCPEAEAPAAYQETELPAQEPAPEIDPEEEYPALSD